MIVHHAKPYPNCYKGEQVQPKRVRRPIPIISPPLVSEETVGTSTSLFKDGANGQHSESAQGLISVDTTATQDTVKSVQERKPLRKPFSQLTLSTRLTLSVTPVNDKEISHNENQTANVSTSTKVSQQWRLNKKL